MDFAGHFPQRDETVDGGGKADGEDAVVGRGARGFEVEVEGALVVVGAEQDQDIQPVQGVAEPYGYVYVVFEGIAVIDIEVPEFAGDQGAGEGGAGGCAPHELVEIFGVEAHHFRVGQETAGDEGQHGIGRR